VLLNVLIYVGGVVSGAAVQYVAGLAGRLLGTRARKSRIGRATIAHQARRGSKVEALSERDGSVLGNVRFPWVVAAFGPFAPGHIRSTFSPTEPGYPEDVEAAFRRIASDLRDRSAVGEPVPSDSEGFKLMRFNTTARTGERDEIVLQLHFCPTTYYRAVATEFRLDQPLDPDGGPTLRELYAVGIDLREAPIPACATHWGVGLAVISADRRFVFARRAATMTEDPGTIYPAVAEGGLRMKDSLPGGAPDHLGIAARGMHEELGVSLDPDELTWLSFGANAARGAFGLVGRVELRLTFDELSLGRPYSKDSWEASELIAVDFEPASVAGYLETAGPIPAFTLAVVTHALIHEYGLARCDRAFRGRNIAASERVSENP
jgi:hypothetical protein